MPRAIRDSDEEVESKSSVRRKRTSPAASVTDSPARRTTRSNKQLTVIESSPEFLDDSNPQPRVRTTRSRAATLDKSATVSVAKSLRSRKNSVSSNVSETVDVEPETIQKRVTRKAAATAATIGTPTKTNPRSRNVRAGSEAKSTPPVTKNKRVTRASSVDPVNTPSESVGTPVKRRTRASMVPVQQTVTEEQETENKAYKTLDHSVVEINEESDNESVTTKRKSTKKVSKSIKDIKKDTSSEQSILDTSNSIEENMNNKSGTSNDTNKESTLNSFESHSISSLLVSCPSKEKESSKKINTLTSSESLVLSTDQNLIKSNELHTKSNENNHELIKSNLQIIDDECEQVDVENLTLTDESIDVVSSPKKIEDTLTLDIKDSYVKLNRTDFVLNIATEKLEENINNDNNLSAEMNVVDSVSQNNVITDAKTAVVLVNDFVKSNEYFNSMKSRKIFDSGISLNNKEDVNSNTSMPNSDDDQISVVSVDIEDNDEMITLNLPSPNEKETQDDKTIIEVLPDDQTNDVDNIINESVSVNSDNVSNFISKKADVYAKENLLKSSLESENLIVMSEEGDKMKSCDTVTTVNANIVDTVDKIGDENNTVSENVKIVETPKMMNASHDNVIIYNSLHESMHNDNLISTDVDDEIVSVNVNPTVTEIDDTGTDFKDSTKNQVKETSEVGNAYDTVTESRVASEENNAFKDLISPNLNDIENNDSVVVNNSSDTEITDLNKIEPEISTKITDTNEQLELMDTSISESNSNENNEITNICILNETNTNEIESKLSSEDINGVSSAVTDADGENASSPTKVEDTHKSSADTTPKKSPGKSKGKFKSRTIDSDLDESAESLFQDIPAEEWSNEQSKRRSIVSKNADEIQDESITLIEDKSLKKDKSIVDKTYDEKDHSNKPKKSRKSVEEVTNISYEPGNEKANQSVSKNARKSLERKRESGQSSDSGIQDSNKTIIENDADESDNEKNESRNNSRLSLDKSLKANQSLAHIKNESIIEKLSKSLNDTKSSNKSRKSLNNSVQFNLSVFDTFRKRNDSLSEKLSTPLNNSNSSKRHSLNDSRNSMAEDKIDENIEEEAMEVDDGSDSENEMNKANDSSNKSRKSFNNTQTNQSPSKNNNTNEKSSVSLNVSKTAKRLSLDKPLNKSSRKSSAEQAQEGKTDDDELIVDVVDSNQSVEEITNNISLSKNRKSFNQSSMSSKNDSLSENLSTSLNNSKTSKKRLSEKLDKSSRKSLIKEINEEKESEDEETEVDVVSEKFTNKSRNSLNQSSSNKLFSEKDQIADAEAITSFKDKDKSLKETSVRKSISQSLSESDVVVDDESETETESREDGEKKNSSINKSLKSILKSCTKTPTNKDTEKTDESINEDSSKEDKEEEAEPDQQSLDRSLQKSIERMKFANPSNHDFSTVVQINSSAEDDSDDDQIPNFMFKSTDGESINNSSSEEEEQQEDVVDSDIEREYNLNGKDISKYSDDDVPGDDCRVSEEESSDAEEDDGADLEDFVVPDEEVEDTEEDESDAEENEHDDETDEENEDENEVGVEEDDEAEFEDTKSKVNVSKRDKSINSSRSVVKNSSIQLQRSGLSQSSGSESDDEATEAENKNSDDRFNYAEDSEKLLKDSKKLEEQCTMLSNMIKSNNTSIQKKDKSMNKSSKSAKSNVSSNSESDGEGTITIDESQIQQKEKSVNVSAKNKSLNLSKSIKEKSANVSKSFKDKSVNLSKSNKEKSIIVLNESKSSKSIRIEESGTTESSNSDSEDYEESSNTHEDENVQIASPSESGSESEKSEDSYHVVNTESSILKSKNKKLIECSTPKPGVTKKADFSKDSLSITASKRKSGSLNDLTDTKMMSSRVSIGEAASKSMKRGDTSIKLKDDVEIVATPETVTKTRQAWKLIPLNHTVHPTVEDTPGTKFLKKAKLNDSFPVLDSMKSNHPVSDVKKGKKAALKDFKEEEMLPKAVEKSKKRKLLDMSNMQSVDEDSILKVSKKNKKRARFDDSTILQNNEDEEVENVDRRKKRIKQVVEENVAIIEETDTARKNKKKKKNKANQVEVEEEVAENYQEIEEKPKKKKKKKSMETEEANEEDQVVDTVKPIKKKAKLVEIESEQSDKKSKKKSKKQVVSDSDDEAPENIGFEEARRLALIEMQQQTEGIKAMKKTLKKKRKNSVEDIQNAKETKTLKRLPEDVLENLTDQPLRRPDKRQKLSRNKERGVIMPSKSMFSPGKSIPENLHVDDSYIRLSSAGGTTEFAVVNLQKAKKISKKSAAVMNFREKMLARNARMPSSAYLSYLKKQKAKGNL